MEPGGPRGELSGAGKWLVPWGLMGFYGGLMGFNGIYPLVNVYITMERSTIFNGKTHYSYGHFQ